MMKKLLLTAFASLLISQTVLASDTEEVFLTAQGKLILPHLNIDGKIYYVELTRVGTTGYNFILSTKSVVDVTPPAPGTPNATVWATANQLVGNWKIPDGTIKLTLGADGTFTLDTPADNSDPKDICPAGRETGTYRYDPTTGIFATTVKTDTDGTCGFSHPNGPTRIKPASNGLTLIDYNNGTIENNSLIPQ